MRLKTYQAYSMAEALAAVKRDLGRDAVILHTRSFRKGGLLGMGGRQMWEITASANVNVPPAKVRGLRGGSADARAERVAVIDGPAYVPAGEAQPALAAKSSAVHEEHLNRQVQALTSMVEKLVRRHEDADKPAVPDELFESYLHLIEQEVAEDIAKELVGKLREQLTGEQLRDGQLIRARMMQYVAGMIPTSAPTVTRNSARPRVIALIGPTGVGKTTTIAKLAANFKLREGLRVGLITIDTYRIAAVDQLRTYADIIQVPLNVVAAPDEMAETLAGMQGFDVVLIDTAGRSQNDTLRLGELERFLKAAKPDEVHLVLSTTASQRNVQSALGRFGHLGIDRLILTKLDEAVSFGMILNVVRQVNKALSYVTTGQDVPDDIEVTQGRRIAELIVGGNGSC